MRASHIIWIYFLFQVIIILYEIHIFQFEANAVLALTDFSKAIDLDNKRPEGYERRAEVNQIKIQCKVCDWDSNLTIVFNFSK